MSVAVAHEASSAVRLEPAVSDRAARLFRQHSGWIYGYCLRQLRSPDEAEDALQATYLNACRSLKQGFEPQADSAWLFKVAQNVCLSRLRSSGRRARLERLHDVALLEDAVVAPHRPLDELIGLPDALASLTAEQRRAILLREWRGLSYREVAAELRLSQSAVETLIFRARRSLAAALENPESRRPRLLHGLGLPGLLASAKSFFLGGGTAVGVKVAATVAVATTATVMVADPVGWHVRARAESPQPTTSPVAARVPPAAVAAVAEPDTVASRPGAERSDHLPRIGAAPARPAPARPKELRVVGQPTTTETEGPGSAGGATSAVGAEGNALEQANTPQGNELAPASEPRGKAQARGQAKKAEKAPPPKAEKAPLPKAEKAPPPKAEKAPPPQAENATAPQAEASPGAPPEQAAGGESPPPGASNKADEPES
jgi:RNA polymerase sigma-70 factor (ECF subfamily)